MTTIDADGTDRYERAEVIAAPVARIWAAITEPDQLRQWFAASTYPLEPGGAGLLEFRYADGSEDSDPVEVVAVEPPHRFAFRWRSYPSDDALPLAALPSTLVEISLTPVAGGTLVRIVESGFRGLPDALRTDVLRDNTGGWDAALRDLAAFVARA